jgi:hypothetical protein
MIIYIIKYNKIIYIMSTLLNSQDISFDIGFGNIPLVVYGALGITSFIIAATTVRQITNKISDSTESEPESAAEPEQEPEPAPATEEKQGGKKKNKKTKSKKPKANNTHTRSRR